MRGLRRLIAIPIAVVWLLAARRVCQAQSESDLAKASQNPVADLVSFPLQFNFNSGGGLGSKSYLLLNVQPVMPLPVDKQWLFVSRTVVPYVNAPLPDDTRITGLADVQEQGYFTPRNHTRSFSALVRCSPFPRRPTTRCERGSGHSDRPVSCSSRPESG